MSDHPYEERYTRKVGGRSYRVTDTGRPRKNVSRETTSPVYKGGIILEVKTKGNWGFLDRFDDKSRLEDFFNLVRRRRRSL